MTVVIIVFVKLQKAMAFDNICFFCTSTGNVAVVFVSTEKQWKASLLLQMCMHTGMHI